MSRAGATFAFSPTSSGAPSSERIEPHPAEAEWGSNEDGLEKHMPFEAAPRCLVDRRAQRALPIDPMLSRARLEPGATRAGEICLCRVPTQRCNCLQHTPLVIDVGFRTTGDHGSSAPVGAARGCIYSRTHEGARGCFAAHQLSCARLLNAVPPAEPGDPSRVSQMRLNSMAWDHPRDQSASQRATFS